MKSTIDPKIRNQLIDEHINRTIEAWSGNDERTLLSDVQITLQKLKKIEG